MQKQQEQHHPQYCGVLQQPNLGMELLGTPPARALVETWDGSSWTEVGDLNTARANLGGGGTTSLAIAVAGSPGPANTEQYDGSAWAEVADLSTGRYNIRSCGTSRLAVAAGGESPKSTATEEWTQSQNIKVITD